MADKREFKRRSASSEFTVKDRTNNEVIGLTRDLSYTGIHILTNREFEVPSFVWCLLEFPEKIEGKNDFEFDAEIKWCKKSDIDGFYEIGCEIKNLSKESKLTIVEITHQLMTLQSESKNKDQVQK